MKLRSQLCRILVAFVAITIVGGFSVQAQQTVELTTGWAEFPGLYEKTDSGSYTGFRPELARAIAERAGFELDFVEFQNPRDAILAQASGETQFAAGPPHSAILSTNVFSDPIAETAVYLFVREDPAAPSRIEDMEGAAIGYVPQSAGSDLADLDGRTGELVPFSDLRDAFGALVMGRIDGVVTTYKFAVDLLRETGLDSRIRTIDPALRTESIHALLAPGSEHLMPRVNAAISELRADGTLDHLLESWNLVRPAPAPEVLTVGVARFPPYQVIEEDGTMTGYGVEALKELAARAGLPMRFVPLTSDEWAAGPSDETYDLLPPLSVTGAKRRQMDFTIPLQESPYSIFLRAGDPRPITNMEDLSGLRVGFTRNSWGRSLASRAPDIEEVIVPDEAALLETLLSGDVDAVIYANATLRAVAERRGVAEEIRAVTPPVAISERAIGLRPGLGTVRERLDAVIPGYLASEDYQALREQWLQPQPFWTSERLQHARILIALILFLTIVLTFLLILNARRRAMQRALEMESLSNRLAAILNTARSGILGFGRNGEILVANVGARRLISEPDLQPPFRWPEGITFVEPENLSPLEASRDPINRALAGAALKGEVSILRQGESNGKLRYISVSSSSVPTPAPGDVATVVILDDVTEHERNRQHAEQSARLDALGQMTGGIAHDFNNLLATVQYAATLIEDAPQEKARDYLKSIRKTVARGSELTRRLLTFSKQTPGMERSVSIRDVMAEFERLSSLTLEPGVTLEYDIQDEDLCVFCDVAQLESALLNLVINSRDAIIRSGEGNRIVVSVRGLEEAPIQSGHPSGRAAHDPAQKTPRLIDFSVTDNGPGMTEEVRRRATDPFFTTKGMSSGTGLGLSMVYGFVDSAGGEMTIYSEEHNGTTVRLILPRGTDTGEREGAMDRPEPRHGGGQRILIVEDEPELLVLVAAVVHDLGYEILTAVSGEDALAVLQRGEPCDLLLTDVVMPGGIGGFELARQVREMHPTLPIIYMSGYTGVSAKDMGTVIAPILQKPCPPSNLAKALRKALDAE